MHMDIGDCLANGQRQPEVPEGPKYIFPVIWMV